MLKQLTSLLLAVSILALSAGAQKRSSLPQNSGATLIVGGTVVTMDTERRVIQDGAVLVRGAKIEWVGPRSELGARARGARVVNAAGKAVIPGLINTHTHVPMSLFRGISDDLDLQEWLTKYIFPAEAKNVDETFVRAGTRLGLAEMIKGGTTTYCDMYYFEDAIADETKRAGMRGVLGETILDFPAPDNKTWSEGIAYSEKFVRKWANDPLITAAIAPHSPYTVSEDHLKEARSVANRLNAPLVIHLAEAFTETQYVAEKYNWLRPVEFVEKIGLLNGKTIAAHVVHASEADLDTLLRRGVGIAHNPQSNMKLAAGIAPVPSMLRKGMNVGLGTDSAASNNDVSMWEEMDTAAKLHKLTSGDPKTVSAVEAFAMATIGGAKALHMSDSIGSIQAGKLADIVLVDLTAVELHPLYNIYSHLVYTIKASNVESVMINGRWVLQNRRLLTLNESAIKRDANAYRRKIISSLED